MSFTTGARLDPSQVEDVRGSRIGGRGLMVGGGGIGVIVALVWLLLGLLDRRVRRLGEYGYHVQDLGSTGGEDTTLHDAGAGTKQTPEGT